MAQGHRYLCAKPNRRRRLEGVSLGGVATMWQATRFALRHEMRETGPVAGDALHQRTSALHLGGSGRMWLDHMHGVLQRAPTDTCT